MQIESDVIIIGGGAAGLSLALRLADTHRISLISKVKLEESCTFYAQGGIAAVLDSDDSIHSHVMDTLDAGAGLCHPDVVNFTAQHGKENIEWLIAQGVPFTTQTGSGKTTPLSPDA